MQGGAGLLLIIFALFALWAYNTGRAQAILSVIKNPAPTNITSSTSSSSNNNASATGAIGGVLAGGDYNNVPTTTGGITGGTLPGFNAPASSSRCADAYSLTCIDSYFGL